MNHPTVQRVVVVPTDHGEHEIIITEHSSPADIGAQLREHGVDVSNIAAAEVISVALNTPCPCCEKENA